MGEQEEKQILLLAELKSLPEEEMDFHRALYRHAGSALAERTLGDYYRDLYPLCCQ